MVYNLSDKRTSGSSIKNENIPRKELTIELHNSIIRKVQKRKVHSSFRGNISGVDFTDMQLISEFNKGILFFYYVLLIYLVNMYGLSL